MTTIRQLIQTSPARADDLFAKLLDTSETAVKTRERLFGELKGELETLASLEEQHLFPVLRKHKDLKDLVREALNDNKATRKLLTELDHTPKDSEEFATRVGELRKVFQQHVRDDKKELLPAILQALTDEEAASVVVRIEAEKSEIEEARRAEALERRVEARQEREKAEDLLAEQKEAARRERKTREAAQHAAEDVARTATAAAESAQKIVRSAAESVQRVAASPTSTGSLFWDAMFGMWAVPQGGPLARRTSTQAPTVHSSQDEEVIPLAEETLILGKHTVTSGTTTVRRFVVESPAEKQITLYDEKVVVERRRPVTDAATGKVLTELSVEMIETSEIPLVAKDIKVREEVVVRRERTKRVETVRETVRRDEVEIQHSAGSERSGKKQASLAYSRK